LQITQDNYSVSLKTVLPGSIQCYSRASLCASAYPLFYSYSDDSFYST